MDFIPDQSEIQVSNIKVHNDQVLKDLIKSLKVKHLIPALDKKRK